MQHLTEEELVMHHYRESEDPAAAAEHLQSCDICRDQYHSVRRVLALVGDAPIPERGEQYGAEVWNRLRWKLGTSRRSRRPLWTGLAAAAMLALAFFAGQLWRARNAASIEGLGSVERAGVSSTEAGAPFSTAEGADRVLLVVVSDHLDSTERILLELVNADPDKTLDVADKQKRAQDLVVSNRMYRQTAQLHGEKRIASVLSDLEPILVELANAKSSSLDRRELAEIQKRIEARGLLFKVRIVGAQVTSEEKNVPGTTDSL